MCTSNLYDKCVEKQFCKHLQECVQINENQIDAVEKKEKSTKTTCEHEHIKLKYNNTRTCILNQV